MVLQTYCSTVTALATNCDETDSGQRLPTAEAAQRCSPFSNQSETDLLTKRRGTYVHVPRTGKPWNVPQKSFVYVRLDVTQNSVTPLLFHDSTRHVTLYHT